MVLYFNTCLQGFRSLQARFASVVRFVRFVVNLQAMFVRFVRFVRFAATKVAYLGEGGGY